MEVNTPASSLFVAAVGGAGGGWVVKHSVAKAMLSSVLRLSSVLGRKVPR